MQDERDEGIDWQLVRGFLAVAEAGSVSAAAVQLKMTQPTLSRGLRSLEETLGYPLFVRHARGVRLTPEGEALLEAARHVEAAMKGFERTARATVEAAGTLRIAATEHLGIEVLAPRLAALRERHPRLAIELVLDNQPSDLTQGEADLAVRLYKPTQPELVARRVGAIPLGLFASRDYLARRGAPTSLEEALEHDLIGFDPRGALSEGFARFEPRLTATTFTLRTDSLAAQLAACRAGCGLSAQQLAIAKRYPELVRVLPELPLPPLDLWLVAHEDMRRSQAVQLGFTWLDEVLTDYCREAP
jgi:DNA-binding transcriptional LysR family regulator